MLLYRAQSMPTGLRLQAPTGNDPSTRIAGRWFTDDLEAAYGYLALIDGAAQIVCVEIADAVAESFRVSNTPVTQCGLLPFDHSSSPASDFVIPRFFSARAEEIETVASDEPCQIVKVDFTGRIELGRVRNEHGDTVLYAERQGEHFLTVVSEQSGGSVSLDVDGAADMGALLNRASIAYGRQAA